MAKVVTMGEIMLRLSPPGYQRFAQASEFEINYGGAEANVAVSLAQLGHDVTYISKIPSNAIGEAAIATLKKTGVDCRYIARGGKRLGVYFLENGASVRPSNVVYDRADSSITQASAEEFDFDQIFDGVDLFHVSGITPVLSEETARLTRIALQKAKEQLKRNFSPSVLYGLCLHLNAVITGKREKSAPDKESIAEILVYHRAEYLLSEELAEQIKAEYAVELSMEEILLLTMFLCYQNEEKTENARPVLIFAFYGVGIASSIAQTVSNMTKLDNIFSYEITSERASAEVYGTLRNFLKKVQQGKGILVIYDSSFLGEMLLEIENELEIPIRQVRVPVTTLGIELARRTLTENDPDKILQSTVESIDGLDCYRKYIVTLCTTGKGGAEELKRYIEKYGQLEDTEVIPMSVTDKELLRDNLKHLMTTGVVQCIVGTYDPGMFAIPFLPISEVFGARKESLPRLLRLEKEAKAKIDYDAMFAYLGEQLTHTDIEKLRKILPDIMKEINAALRELSLDAEAGLLIHISCCIDRLLAKQEVATNPRKAAILLQYDKEFKKLLKIVKPLEKTFHVIINDDEIANILTIIYQL